MTIIPKAKGTVKPAEAKGKKTPVKLGAFEQGVSSPKLTPKITFPRKPKVKNIPEELKELRQWVCWKYRPSKKRPKPEKPPYDPKITNKKLEASPTDSSTWGTFQDAIASLMKHGFDGIGIAITEGDPYVAIDLDNCRTPQAGKRSKWAGEIIEKLNSYVEASPSGEGYRIFVKVKGDYRAPSQKKKGNFQVIQSKLYVTVTGHVVEGRKQIRSIEAETLQKVCEEAISYQKKRAAEKKKQKAKKKPLKWDGDVNTLPVDSRIKGLITKGEEKGKRSDAQWDVLRAMIEVDMSDEQIHGIFQQYPIGEKADEKGGAREGWLQADIERAREGISGGTPSLVTADELLSKKIKIEKPIIHGIMRKDGAMIITGISGVGKSTVALNLAVCLAAGQPFLGKAVLKKHKVLILQSENDAITTRRRLKGIISAIGNAKLRKRVKRNITFMGGPDGYAASIGYVHDKGFQACILGALKRTKADIMIIDPVSDYMGGMSENDNNKVRNALNAFRKLVRENGGSLIYTHHHGKQRYEGQLQSRGGMAFTDYARAALNLNEVKGQGRTLTGEWSKTSGFPNPGTVQFRVNPDFTLSPADEFGPTIEAIKEVLSDKGGEFPSKSQLKEDVKKHLVSQGMEVGGRKILKAIDEAAKRNAIKLVPGKKHNSLKPVLA